MDWITILLLLVAGVLALSALITARLPQAKDVISKIVPLQGVIGVALLVFGLIWAVKMFPDFDELTGSQVPMSVLLAVLGAVISFVALGFVFGMPLIAQWIPGDSPAEQKALDAQKKLLPFQTLLGALALISVVLFFLARGTTIGKAAGSIWNLLSLIK